MNELAPQVGDQIAWAWYRGSSDKRPRVSSGTVEGFSKNHNPIVTVDRTSDPETHKVGERRVVRTTSMIVFFKE